jgi:hypothetical protein
MVKRCNGILLLESNGKKVQRDFPLIMVIHINLQVLTGRWDDLFSCLIPCLFGDTGIEPTGLDL